MLASCDDNDLRACKQARKKARSEEQNVFVLVVKFSSGSKCITWRGVFSGVAFLRFLR